VVSVGQTIQFLTGGVLMGRFRPDDAQDELDIRVRFPASARNIAAIDQLKITTPAGRCGQLLHQARRRPAGHPDPAPRGPAAGGGAGQHHRGVAGNLKIAELKPWLAKAPIDPSVTTKFVGADERATRRPCSSWSPIVGHHLHDERDPALAVQQLLRRAGDALGGDPVDDRRAAGRAGQLSPTPSTT
jgi:hypothetical protein